MIKSDKWIKRMVGAHGMIDPFVPTQISEVDNQGVISFGVSSYGYDIRLSPHFRVFTNAYGTVIVDPKNFDPKAFVEIEGEHVIIPPNSFCLSSSIESFKIPRDVTCLCLSKSSYARCGISVGMTPFEAGWEGQPTLEIFNTTPLPAKVYANEGICQVIFFQSDEQCETSYADRKGKYQHQKGVTLPKLKR